MDFDINRVFTTVNADEVLPGSIGYFADFYNELKRKVREGDDIRELTYVYSADYINRFKTKKSIYSLFYLVEEPESEPAPKEVTASEWDNRPRLMKVWDDDYSEAKERKVIYIASKEDNLSYPVVVLNPAGDIYVGCFKHCAEIDVTKEKTYRTYSNADELIADYKKRFCPDYKGMPAIWVRNRVGTLREIVSIDDDGVRLTGAHILFVTYSDFFNTYTYSDGSPCGMEE